MSVLLITNRQDYTADFVVLELQRRKIEYFRLNTEDIPTRARMAWQIDSFEQGYIDILDRSLPLSAITAIWFRRPVPPIPSSDLVNPSQRQFAVRESQAAFIGALRTLQCEWVSHPDALHAASFKIVQLERARRLGFKIPQTIVTSIPDAARQFLKTLGSAAIYKTLLMSRFPYLDGEAIIFTSEVTPEDVSSLETIVYAPALFQQLIPKATDIRVTVIGKKVFAIAIHSQFTTDTLVDWRRGDVNKLHHEVIGLPEDIEAKCRNLVLDFGLRFGCIDLVVTPSGDFVFLEINGNGQWAWIEQLTGLPLTATLVDVLTKHEITQQ